MIATLSILLLIIVDPGGFAYWTFLYLFTVPENLKAENVQLLLISTFYDNIALFVFTNSNYIFLTRNTVWKEEKILFYIYDTSFNDLFKRRQQNFHPTSFTPICVFGAESAGNLISI